MVLAATFCWEESDVAVSTVELPVRGVELLEKSSASDEVPYKKVAQTLVFLRLSPILALQTFFRRLLLQRFCVLILILFGRGVMEYR